MFLVVNLVGQRRHLKASGLQKQVQSWMPKNSKWENKSCRIDRRCYSMDPSTLYTRNCTFFCIWVRLINETSLAEKTGYIYTLPRCRAWAHEWHMRMTHDQWFAINISKRPELFSSSFPHPSPQPLFPSNPPTILKMFSKFLWVFLNSISKFKLWFGLFSVFSLLLFLRSWEWLLILLQTLLPDLFRISPGLLMEPTRTSCVNLNMNSGQLNTAY